MKVLWKDIAQLLDGNEGCGQVAASTLADCIAHIDLPELFHDLCVRYVVSEKLTTRLNASLALKLVCDKHSSMIQKLVHSGILYMTSLVSLIYVAAQSDGTLIGINDICLSDILHHGEELFNNDEVEDMGNISYDPKWVRRQRALLRKKLGKLSSSDAVSKYSDVDSIIDENDVTILASKKHSKNISSVGLGVVNVVVEPASGSDDTSKENWFVRILRVMISGVLHSRWERRHGYCIALIAIIEGMGWIQRTSESQVALVVSHLRLPHFLAEDILTACISVLLLDRFMDITGEASAVSLNPDEIAIRAANWQSSLYSSPVKEAAAELISVACAAKLWCNGVDEKDMEAMRVLFFSRVVHASVEMCRYKPEVLNRDVWKVVHSGLVLIKHMLRSENCLNTLCSVPLDVNIMIQVILEAISLYPNDDIRGAAVETFHMRPIAGLVNGTIISAVISPHVTNILRTFQALIPSISGVLASSLLVASAQSIYQCMSIWFASKLTAEMMTPDCMDALVLAVGVGSDVLTRCLHLHRISHNSDVELSRALPICLKLLLVCICEVHCLVPLGWVHTRTVEWMAVRVAVVRACCKCISVPIRMGVDCIYSEDVDISAITDSTRANTKRVKNRTHAEEHVSNRDRLVKILKYVQQLPDSVQTEPSSVSGHGNLLVALSKIMLEWLFECSPGSLSHRRELESSKKRSLVDATDGVSKVTESKKKKRRGKKEIKYCDDVDESVVGSTMLDVEQLATSSNVLDLAECIKQGLMTVSYSGNFSVECIGDFMGGDVSELNNGLDSARIMASLIAVEMENSVSDKSASIRTILDSLLQHCQKVTYQLQHAVDVWNASEKVKTIATPIFFFSDPSLNRHTSESNVEDDIRDAVRKGSWLGWIVAMVLYSIDSCIRLDGIDCASAIVNDAVADIMASIKTIVEVVTPEQIESIESNSIAVFNQSLSFISRSKAFLDSMTIDNLSFLMALLPGVKCNFQREFYCSMIANSILLFRHGDFLHSQMYSRPITGEVEGEHSGDNDFNIEEICCLAMEALDSMGDGKYDVDRVMAFLSDSRLLLDVLSCDIITTDMCGICDLKFEDHSMLISLANSSASRCGEIIVAILSKKRDIEIFSMDIVIKCATDPIPFGFSGEDVAKIQMALLKFMAISLHFADEIFMKRCIDLGGLTCAMDVACERMVSKTAAVSETTIFGLPQFDVRHKHIDDDTLCRCSSSGQTLYGYSSTMLSLVMSVLLSLCGDAPDFIRTRHVPTITRSFITLVPTLVVGRLMSVGSSDSSFVALSMIFLQLVCALQELILIDYNNWVSVSLMGMGHFGGPLVRKNFTQALRVMVPLAPLLTHINSPLQAPSQELGQEDSSCEDAVKNMVEGVLMTSGLDAAHENNSGGAANDIQTVQIDLEHRIALMDTAFPPEEFDAMRLTFSSTLRGYQLRGVSWISQLWDCGLGGILADEMGLGKTVQTIAALCLRKWKSGSLEAMLPPSLVVCPAMLLSHWEMEVNKFAPHTLLRPVRLSEMIDTETRKRAAISRTNTTNDSLFIPERNKYQDAYDYVRVVESVILALQSHHVILISYDLLRRIYKESLLIEGSTYTPIPATMMHTYVFDAIVVDEAHCLRNPKTELYKCITALKSTCRIALTGTPVQNRVEDIWSLVNFIIPDFLGDFKSFKKHTVGPIQKAFADDECQTLLSTSLAAKSAVSDKSQQQMHEVSAEGLRLLHNLHKQVMPFILRRTKEIALPELPPKIIVDVFCPLSSLQRLLYAQFQRGLQISDDLLEKELIERLPILASGDVIARANERVTTYTADRPTYHPFQALSYLKRLCVHPLLVKDICDASTHLTLVDEEMDIFTSGKLCQLVNILTEQNIVSYRSEATKLRVEGKIRSFLRPGDDVDREKLSSAESSSDDDDDDGSSESIQSEEEDKCDNLRSIESATDKQAQTQPLTTPKKKCLIFAEHRSTLDIIEKEVFKGLFPHERVLLLDGRVDANSRAQQVVAFNSGVSTSQSGDAVDPDACQSPRILLLTVASCGLGLNLSAAEVVIFVEHSWNPFVDLQAMDRVHRFGQLKSATVFRILAESTIESRIQYLQKVKSVVADKIVGNNDDESVDYMGGGQEALTSLIVDSIGRQLK